jgi:hypothetical protein
LSKLCNTQIGSVWCHVGENENEKWTNDSPSLIDLKGGAEDADTGATAMAPLKLAIVGGGPSSFYVASRLLSIFPQNDAQLRIHVYDRLWAPHGLVRYGVAPDHPEVKVRPRASLCLAPRLSKTEPELHAQVRSGRQRPPATFLWERTGWAANRANDPTCAPHITVLPPAALHASPLLHRLRHTRTASLSAALRPCHTRSLTRPLVHASPVTSRASTAARHKACLYHRPGKRRAGCCTHATHPSRIARKIRHLRTRSRSPP